MGPAHSQHGYYLPCPQHKGTILDQWWKIS